MEGWGLMSREIDTLKNFLILFIKMLHWAMSFSIKIRLRSFIIDLFMKNKFAKNVSFRYNLHYKGMFSP